MNRIQCALLTACVMGLSGTSVAGLTWSSTSTVKTIFVDRCDGANPVTAFWLTDNSGPYFFPNSDANSKQWLSQLELSLASSIPVNVKYETNGVNPGSTCGFNPGYAVQILSVNP